MGKSILRKGYLKVKLSKKEMLLLREIKGDSDLGDFVGFLIRSYRGSDYKLIENTVPDKVEDIMINNIRLCMNRIIDRVEVKKLVDGKVTSITESIAELTILDKVYQVQLRLQNDRSAFIDPASYELGANEAIYL